MYRYDNVFCIRQPNLQFGKNGGLPLTISYYDPMSWEIQLHVVYKFRASYCGQWRN